ncbi:MAG: hypothetical protein IJ737_04990 [Ruminococcus sp.]|nr:hypothetical protein [Ruminococcus sp.]
MLLAAVIIIIIAVSGTKEKYSYDSIDRYLSKYCGQLGYDEKYLSRACSGSKVYLSKDNDKLFIETEDGKKISYKIAWESYDGKGEDRTTHYWTVGSPSGKDDEMFSYVNDLFVIADGSIYVDLSFPGSPDNGIGRWSYDVRVVYKK